jgi:inosose dehydratase
MPGHKWGYAINQWRSKPERLVRREQQERAFKEMSACGFRGIQLKGAFGYGEHLGSPGLILLDYGSADNFRDYLRDCGIDQVVSFTFEPSQSPSNPENHERILEAARSFTTFLHDINGLFLVASAMPSYWREAPVTEAKIKNAAECWNKVGKMTRDYGIQLALHTDFLCAVHSMDDIDKLMQFTDPGLVGLVIDTGELTVAGMNPLAVYDKHYSRVKLFHFKDTHDKDTLEEYKEENADLKFLTGGGKREIERWFWEMGEPGGLVDFPALMKSIKARSYDGWIVVESENSVNPSETAALNSWYVKKVLDKV